MKKHLFQSERLGFRIWSEDDLDAMHEMNSNPNVMRHFPRTKTKEESLQFILDLQEHYQKYSYTYFAVDRLDTNECIGFIGLAYQTYEAAFTPSPDIGWRLLEKHWNNGFATEGARRCLEYAKELGLERVVAIASRGNIESMNVMRKIGMEKKGIFKHPNLKDFPRIEECVWYEYASK